MSFSPGGFEHQFVLMFDFTTLRFPASSGGAWIQGFVVFLFCRLRRRSGERGCEDTSRSGRRAGRPPAPPGFLASRVLPPPTAKWRERVRGHLALRQEGGSPPAPPGSPASRENRKALGLCRS